LAHFFAVLLCCVAQTKDSTELLAESGRDYPETRLFTACQAKLTAADTQYLVVGGFTDTGQGDVSDVLVYSVDSKGAALQWRTMWKGDIRSSIRTLRAADLDGDGRDEIIVLGRMGDEDVSGEGELKVLGVRNGALGVLDAVHWQSGKYTHGYGMAIGDVDGDGKPEITSGGFFSDGKHEHAEVRVWRFRAGKIELVARTDWGELGETRINAVDVGDIDGDGRLEIFTAGRTGQVKNEKGETTDEQGELTAWRLDGDKLNRFATHEWVKNGPSRFRELKACDVNGDGKLEVFAAGRFGNDQHPYMGLFQVKPEGFQLASEPRWEKGRLGEIRDVQFHGRGNSFRVVTIGADGVKPNRQGQMRTWKLAGPRHDMVEDWRSAHTDENRVRQLVLWHDKEVIELITAGFVREGNQIIGQIVRWGKMP